MNPIIDRIQVVSLILLAFWLLSACTPIIHSKSQVQPDEKKLDQTSDILSYYAAIRVMSAADLELELARARASLNLTALPRNQLRLAMLLGMPEFRFNHDREAEQLLKEYLLNEKTPAFEEVQIAWLLTNEIQWRTKIQQDLQTLQQEIQDLQALKQEPQNLQTLKKELQDERISSSKLLEKLKIAQSKLNQLSNIDKNINAREQEISTPSTDKIPHDPK